MQYDYLIVGSGLFGAVFAYEMKKRGRKILVIDKREHIAGNIYTESVLGIQVHKYGAHIFHTSDKKVWDYMNGFASFNHYINSPIARYHDELYNLPFNMNTFSKMWGVVTPAQAKAEIDRQIAKLHIDKPRNLEEQALSLVGRDVYEKLVKGYTQKQWGRDCTELPAFIIKRLPLRFTYDNNYFNDPYQGIPVGGYTAIIEKMLQGIEVKTGISYQEYIKSAPDKENPNFVDRAGNSFTKVLYTGMIDEYFQYQLGYLEYRSLRFEQEEMAECENYQGNAVVNYTDKETPYTRIIEHKHFEFGRQPGTVITREYPAEWKAGDEPYYPVNNEKNDALFAAYQKLADSQPQVLFGGRLGAYRYYDMDKVIAAALQMVEAEAQHSR
ncbi:MAG: UDP-galactopyranose mutase [Bacillus sp. (in: Bacteria)]|nr:UDP-galactopyranose mutase [Bacillus sp. (in: firmicutes)]MCM1425782.1 UDP-galactopyranose mutase [Eubacterium sp.]